MDLLAELHAKLATLDHYKGAAAVRAAVRHIEAAKRHLQRGRKGRDDDAFTDVVYRTNQAFEGMLREAYVLLHATSASSLSLHQIEQKFVADGTFSPRVLTAFERYRKEWRNPSTHDHTLLFSEQEALLAIVSVSAFAVVLLDQMIEVFSFREQQQGQRPARSVSKLLWPITRSLPSTIKSLPFLLRSAGS